MCEALGVCKQTDLFGLQETHGSLPDAMEFARLAGGAKCFSAWSAVGMEVVDFLEENLVFGSSSAPGASEHVLPFEGKRDTYDHVNGVLGHDSEYYSETDSSYSSATFESCSSSVCTKHSRDQNSVSSASGGVFNIIKR